MSFRRGTTAISTVPYRPGGTFTRRAKRGLVTIMWLRWHVAVGVSGNMRHQGITVFLRPPGTGQV